jgi:hypothetical protein
MAMIIDNKFDIGDLVFITTDPEQLQRMVVSLIVNRYDVIYEVQSGTTSSRHYDFEISKEKNVLTTIE